MTTKLMIGLVGVVAAWSAGARVICEAESPTTFVDSRRGVRYVAGTNLVQTLNWNSAWVGGDASAEAVITADGGVELARGTGAGTYVWTNTTYGAQTFTHTTYIGGVAQPEVYTAAFCTIDVTGMGIPGLQRTTLTGKACDTGLARMGVEPIVTCDGEGMYDATIGQKTTYAYTGYMFFRAGETYTFRAFFDGFAWVTMDETSVVVRNAAKCKEGMGAISFAEAGWRKVDFRVANNGGAEGLASRFRYISGTAVDLSPYLDDATRGEADLTVALGPHAFVKVKLESRQVKEGEEE